MTEQQWLACTDPQAMFDSVWTSRSLSGRKLRLFFCARSRHIWDLLARPEYRDAVEVAERFADATANAAELQEASERARQAFWGMHPATAGQSMLTEQATAHLRLYVIVLAANPRLGSVRPSWNQVRMVRERLPEEGREECDLLRELFGVSTARPPAPDPAWFAWNAGTVRRLAEAAYQERALPGGTLDNARLAVLADALEEAGCADAGLLGHLRGPGPHYRGCWAVDLLSGRG